MGGKKERGDVSFLSFELQVPIPPTPPLGLRASSFAFRMEKPPGLYCQPPGRCRQAQLEIWDYSSRPQQGGTFLSSPVHHSSSASFSRLSAPPPALPTSLSPREGCCKALHLRHTGLHTPHTTPMYSKHLCFSVIHLCFE